MNSLLLRIIAKCRETHWRYKCFGSNVRIQGDSEISPDAQIKNSTVYVDKTSTLKLGKRVRLEGIELYLTNGATVEIADDSFIEKGNVGILLNI